MNKWIIWLRNNRNWVFSGAGVAVIVWLLNLSGKSGDINVTASGNGSTAIISTAPVTINQRDPLVAKAIAVLKQQLEAKDMQLAAFQEREQFFQEQIQAVTAAITALPKQTNLPNVEARVEEALTAAADGNPKVAETIFEEIEQRKVAEGKAANKQAAEAARHLGALAFLHDTQKALNAYRRASRLDPDNADGWNRLGQLLYRAGQLREAEAAYRNVKFLGEATNDQGLLGISYTNLGAVYQTRGELDQAVVMYQKSLAIDESLGYQVGMALNYTGLGNVYQTRGELDQAVAMYQKSLAIDESLGHQVGMANNYTNLGVVYKIRGELDQAVTMYQKSLTLFKTMGAQRQVKHVRELIARVDGNQNEIRR